MSLLMKALEKAAKDRVDGEPASPAEPVPPGASPKANSELTLEPIAAQAAAAPESAPAQRAQASPRNKSAGTPAATSDATARESAQVAAMIRAAGQREPSGNVFAYLRDRPLLTFGTLAAIFLVCLGGYVYVQINNPGLFAAQSVRTPASVPIAQAPVPPAPVPLAGSSTSPAAAQPVQLNSLLPPPPEQAASREKPAPPTQAPAATATAATTAAQVPVLAPVATAPPAPSDSIKIVAGNTTPTVNPILTEAYGALNAGNLEASQRLYNQLLRSDPRNVEALLGLAAIATQQGDRDTATKHYVKVMEIDPRNTLAQAGLIGMVGSADPQSAETRVKQLIARDPSSAYLFFTLGNTYIDQNRWPDAQQAFFQAHHLQPDNPDYAYNLAVALEHIGQAKAAMDFYRRAVLLAAAKGHANFSIAVARERIGKLEKVVP